MNISRRELLVGRGAPHGAAGADARRRGPDRRRHDHLCSITPTRSISSTGFLEGYGWNGTHHHPPMDLVSLYVDQVGRDDLSRDRAARLPSMKIYPTIAEALTLGGSKLAVDGVVLVGEHGNYPRNEKRQTQYPRYEFFQEIVKVFRASGRSVPVFNDKHLSWNWDWAKEMYDTSRSMGFRVHGRVEPAGDLAHAVGRDAAGRRYPRGHVRLLWRRGQLRFPRPGNHPVHGGAPQGRRDRREVAAGLPRRELLDSATRKASGRAI